MTRLNSRRAQGISLETIIIAIIVLLVLVIIGYIFATQIGITQKKIADCQSRGGTCVTIEKCAIDGVIATTSCGNGQICCSKLSASNP